MMSAGAACLSRPTAASLAGAVEYLDGEAWAAPSAAADLQRRESDRWYDAPSSKIGPVGWRTQCQNRPTSQMQ